MNPTVDITLPRCLSDKDTTNVADALANCRYIQSTKIGDGVATLFLQPGTSVASFAHRGGDWTYGWYNKPATSIVLVTEQSGGVTYTYGGEERSNTELFHGPGLVFLASSNNGPRTLQPTRVKAILSLPTSRPLISMGSGPGWLCLAKTAHPSIGGRGQPIWYKGNIERTTAGGLSITEWTGEGPESVSSM